MTMPSRIQLAKYDNSWYKPGGTLLKRAAWFFLGQPFLRAAWIPSSALRVRLLRLFGARIGKGVVIKPAIDVKYPWHLIVGDDCWIGEHAWIDNLTTVRIGSNVCISQGAYFCTGNHDWTDPHFGLRVAPIEVGNGAWVGAKSLLTPGVVVGAGAIAAAGSVVTGSIPAFQIFAGNPARFVKKRTLKVPSGGTAPEKPDRPEIETSIEPAEQFAYVPSLASSALTPKYGVFTRKPSGSPTQESSLQHSHHAIPRTDE